MFEISLFSLAVLFVVVLFFRGAISSVAQTTDRVVKMGAYDLNQSTLHAVSERDSKRSKRAEKKGYKLIDMETIEAGFDD